MDALRPHFLVFFVFVGALVIGASAKAQDVPSSWLRAWPQTDFSRSRIGWDEIKSGGPPKDGIPSIDHPKFVNISDSVDLEDTEPVVGLVIGDVWRAYPVRILIWHEIANDVVAGIPVAVTFCPLCNSAIVFDRRVQGQRLEFGTTGKLRNSDLVMYDRQTFSWWQQFSGEGIVGTHMGTVLTVIPSRLESWANFKKRAPASAQVMVPNDAGMRRYGSNPYAGYDRGLPFLYDGDMPKGVKPLARVVSVAGRREAYTLDLLREKGSLLTGTGITLTWEAGQNSALDTGVIARGKDVGNVTATQNGKDVPYFVEFAFAFYAFYPTAPIHVR